MTYEDLRTAIYAYLDRDNIPDGYIAAMVATAHGKIQRALKDHRRNIIRATFTQPANDAFLPIPVDLLQLIGIYAQGIQLSQFMANMRQLAKSFHGFIDKGTCFELFPVPTVDTEYRIDYFAQLPPINTTVMTSTNWVLTSYPDIYVYATLCEAGVFYRDDARYQIWGAELAQRLGELKEQGLDPNLGTAPQIRAS